MTPPLLNDRFSFRKHSLPFCLLHILSSFASKRFQIHFVQIVLQITVGPCDDRIRKKTMSK